MTLSRRGLLTGALALLLAPPDLVPHRKVWALGGLTPPEPAWSPTTVRIWFSGPLQTYVEIHDVVLEPAGWSRRLLCLPRP